MIIDSSAVVAILKNEPGYEAYLSEIDEAAEPRMSIASYLEAAVVIDADRSPIHSRRFDEFLRLVEIELRPVTVEQGRIARAAYRDFGKGSGHPAKLNFGDCLAYALAKELDEPLLFKGNDFIHTDVVPAIRPSPASPA